MVSCTSVADPAAPNMAAGWPGHRDLFGQRHPDSNRGPVRQSARVKKTVSRDSDYFFLAFFLAFFFGAGGFGVNL